MDIIYVATDKDYEYYDKDSFITIKIINNIYIYRNNIMY